MYCKYCGKANKDGQKFCKYCGGKLKQVNSINTDGINIAPSQPSSSEYAHTAVCSACGKENMAGQKFCKYCGVSLIPQAMISPVKSDNDYSPKKPNNLRIKSRGIKVNNRVLIAVISALGVVLIALTISIASYFKSGSFNPANLFRNNDDEQTTENIMDDADDNEISSIILETEHTADEAVPAIEAPAAEEPTDEVDLFAEFLSGNVTATVADSFLSAAEWIKEPEPGKEFTFGEIKEYININLDVNSQLEGISFADPVVTQIPLSVHGENLHALQLYYYDHNLDESISEELVFHENNRKLEIIFAIDECALGTGATTRGGCIYGEGTASLGGHGGAGEYQYSRFYAPDRNFTYRLISDEKTYAPWSDYDYYTFYDEESNSPIESLNQTIAEAAAGDENTRSVRYYMEKINGETYYYYLSDNEDGLSQSTVDYIDAIAANHGFGFDGKAAADAARDAYEKELGVYEICQHTTFPEWLEIK